MAASVTEDLAQEVLTSGHLATQQRLPTCVLLLCDLCTAPFSVYSEISYSTDVPTYPLISQKHHLQPMSHKVPDRRHGNDQMRHRTGPQWRHLIWKVRLLSSGLGPIFLHSSLLNHVQHAHKDLDINIVVKIILLKSPWPQYVFHLDINWSYLMNIFNDIT